jgi:uncharacterized protein (TIGR02466 family)
MFADTNLVGLFPTHVWVHDLKTEESGPLNDTLAAKIDELISPRVPLPAGQFWQTQQDLHALPELAPLNAYIAAATNGVLRFLQIEYEQFAITGCWANVGPQGAWHKGHTHPNNYLSGVYYVKTPPGGDGIVFHDPRPQVNVISPRVATRTDANSQSARVPVQEGRLVVFPSWFGHSVPPNDSEGERISVAFNIMFGQFGETMANPKWTPQDLPTRS